MYFFSLLPDISLQNISGLEFDRSRWFKVKPTDAVSFCTCNFRLVSNCSDISVVVRFKNNMICFFYFLPLGQQYILEPHTLARPCPRDDLQKVKLLHHSFIGKALVGNEVDLYKDVWDILLAVSVTHTYASQSTYPSRGFDRNIKLSPSLGCL